MRDRDTRRGSVEYAGRRGATPRWAGGYAAPDAGAATFSEPGQIS
jgi:hypothetical protein